MFKFKIGKHAGEYLEKPKCLLGGHPYVGQTNEQGLPHGEGTITVPNGHIITGPWKDGWPDGEITIKRPCGCEFLGYMEFWSECACMGFGFYTFCSKECGWDMVKYDYDPAFPDFELPKFTKGDDVRGLFMIFIPCMDFRLEAFD